MMKRVDRKVYLAPECSIVQLSEMTYLMGLSDENARLNGQHNPAHRQQGPSSAKPADFLDDDYDEVTVFEN